jgi:sarcosine oxidase subunit beta
MTATAADVVVIGAGPLGTSVAWHLAVRGGMSVVVLERAAALGAGSAARATGGFRTQFGTAINVQLSLLSRVALLRFQDEVGIDPGYVQAGYLFVARDAHQLQSLRDGLDVQRRCGLTAAREVTPEEIATLNPAFAWDGIEGGSFCPLDGFVRPMALVEGWAADAQRRGVRIVFACGPVHWQVDAPAGGRRRLTGVHYDGGRIATRCVVIAAGAWSGQLAAHGIDIPVRPERRQIAVTTPFGELPADMPMTIDCSDGFHLRCREGRVCLLRPEPSPGRHAFDTTFDAAWADRVLAVARQRVPCLARAAIDLDACRCGLYEMTPDKHALVGPVPQVEGLYLATGNSGHGVMHAPAIGRVVAEMIVDGAAQALDAAPLRPSRFAEGSANPATGVL